MKKGFIFLFLCFGFLLSVGCKHQNDIIKPNDPQNNMDSSSVAQDSSRFPKDMVLIYDGGSERPDWTTARLRPYLYRINNGKVQWLFDGFLFLEITTNDGGKTYSFVVNNNPADKDQWQAVINKTFQHGLGPDALEEMLSDLAKDGITPPHRRKVIISIPNPVHDDKNWGTLNGRNLDFTNDSDRIAAATWYVNQVLQIWKEKDYKYLKLTGFYWVRESIANQSSQNVVAAVSKYLHRQGLDFYWIPYNGAGLASNWKQMGFDIAYQQPNYFFNLSTSYNVLTNAIVFAEQNDMALEMEFDDRLMTTPGYKSRFYDYINAYENADVWNRFPVAYYEGGGAWYDMSQSSDTAAQRALKTLGDILLKRKSENIQFK